MSEVFEPKRLTKVASEFGLPAQDIISFLKGKGVDGVNPNFKVEREHYDLLLKEYANDKAVADAAHKQIEENKARREEFSHGVEVTINSKKAATAEPIVVQQPEPVKPAPVVVVPPVVAAAPPVVEVKPEVVPTPAAEPETLPETSTAEDGTIKAKSGAEGGVKFTFTGEKIDLTPKPKVKASKKAEPEAPKAVESAPLVAPAPVAEVKPEPVAPAAPTAPPKAVSVGDMANYTDAEKAENAKAAPEHHETQITKLSGPKIMGKIELPTEADKKKQGQSRDGGKRQRIKKSVDINQVGANVGQGNPAIQDNRGPNRPGQNRPGQPGQGGNNQGQNRGPGQQRDNKQPLTEEQIQKQVKETLARLSGGGKSKSAKYRRDKRDEKRTQFEAEAEQNEQDKRTIKVTEFVTANELAKLMSVQVNQIIATCMSLGMFVSINQRLDAETLSIVAEEFGFEVEFVSAEVQEAIKEEEDKDEDLKERPPIVTVMGHVDHGKTSLLDYIRKANVIAGEAGGITQHIGAYSVEMENGKHITFLDTPGHEAFTAMRARGAKVTDVVIVVVAADDNVMPQTKEAINHAQAAGVPIVFAINKIDKPGANPEKIKEELAGMNILVEDWGGKYQSQEISAKKGINIDKLLEKVILEAELLELKANPNRNAMGTVIESSLDKGRGFISTILVEKGTLKVGDVILAGCYSGKVKALHNERGQNVKNAGPAAPVIVLGLTGAPQAGDHFNVMDDEREAREIANKRLQLQREQGYRTNKHITLDEIGRRLAIGDFQELNVIVKGDVDGSVEALADSLIKLSTQKIQVNIVHKAVGQISESDIMLASASNAIIVGFQVRPSVSARKLAEQEQIDVRLYSIIYDAIEEVKAAMEGMLAPTMEEKVTCNIEIREVFKITKVGTIAGCMVLDGKVTRQTQVRLIRDGIVVYNGGLGSLKRFKDDVKEVSAGYECGLNIENFNDIKVGDILEGYTQVEVKAKL